MIIMKPKKDPAIYAVMDNYSFAAAKPANYFCSFCYIANNYMSMPCCVLDKKGLFCLYSLNFWEKL